LPKERELLHVALHQSVPARNFVFAPFGRTMRTADPSSVAELRRVDRARHYA
jgi:hypothetical protein